MLTAEAKITPEREWLSVSLPGFKTCHLRMAAARRVLAGVRGRGWLVPAEAFLVALSFILPSRLVQLGLEPRNV